MQEDSEGGVFVRSVLRTDSEALRRIRPFDRVVAVSATLGDRMWRTNSLDGVLSAITTRIGSKVRMQFERSPEVARLVARYGEQLQRRGEEEVESAVSSGGRLTQGGDVGADPRGMASRGATVAESGVLLLGEQRIHSVLSHMAAALRERDPDRAISVYKLAVERGITPDAHCCTSLIKAYGMKRQAGKALEVVRMMLELGVDPDLVTYNTLMDACEKGRKHEEALRIFREELPTRGLSPDIFSYTVLINLHGKRGELTEALSLFDEAVQRGLRPELPAYTAVVKAAVKKDDMLTALSMLRRMFDDGLSPDTRLYNTLSKYLSFLSFYLSCILTAFN